MAIQINLTGNQTFQFDGLLDDENIFKKEAAEARSYMLGLPGSIVDLDSVLEGTIFGEDDSNPFRYAQDGRFHFSNYGSPLGVYRDPAHPGLYANYPIIKVFTEKRYLGWWRAFTPEYGLGAAAATGSLFEGSYRITVYGVGNRPTSWSLHSLQPVRQDDQTQWQIYRWAPTQLSQDRILELDVTRSAMEYFQREAEK